MCCCEWRSPFTAVYRLLLSGTTSSVQVALSTGVMETVAPWCLGSSPTRVEPRSRFSRQILIHSTTREVFFFVPCSFGSSSASPQPVSRGSSAERSGWRGCRSVLLPNSSLSSKFAVSFFCWTQTGLAGEADPASEEVSLNKIPIFWSWPGTWRGQIEQMRLG